MSGRAHAGLLQKDQVVGASRIMDRLPLLLPLLSAILVFVIEVLAAFNTRLSFVEGE